MNEYYIRPIEKSVAKKMIVKNHYSHAWTKCTVALGIYKRGRDHDFFQNITVDKLIGCVIYGDPIRNIVFSSISPKLKPNEVFELTRLWIQDETPKNTESYCISLSFKWLRKFHPHIKCLISYADPEQGHLGRIYQATNWIFQESFHAGNSMISLSDNPFRWMHPKTVYETYGTSGLEQLKSIIPKPYWTKRATKKYRYIYFLCDKIEKQKFMKTLVHSPIPYPKECSKDRSEIKKVE